MAEAIIVSKASVTRGLVRSSFFFFFNDTATTEIYTLSLHDALPISRFPPAVDPQPLVGIASHILLDQASEVRRVSKDFFFRVARIDPVHAVKPQPVFLELRIPDHEPEHNRDAGLARHSGGSGRCAGRASKKFNEDPFARQHVLVEQDAHGFSVLEGPQDVAREVSLLDGLAAAAAAVPIDEVVHERIVHLSHNEVAGVAINPVGKRAKFPVPEVSRQEQDTLPPARGAGEILEPRSEEHTSELQSPCNLVCRLLLEKKKKKVNIRLLDSCGDA